MFSLIGLINRHLHLILFILLEIVSFFLIINYNQKQKDIFIHSSSLFSGTILNMSTSVNSYFSLDDVNQRLIEENANLLRENIEIQSKNSSLPIDTNVYAFDVIAARIIGQSIHSSHNQITIDKGNDDGLEGSHGLINHLGVVGILTNSTRRFSSGLSLLNTKTRVSASVQNKNYFGTVVWKGRDIKKASLEGIPSYAVLEIGDTVVTNGYSTLFPQGIPIGFISKVHPSPKGSYQEIDITLANDFSDLDYVYVIRNNFAPERQSLNLE
jgi:rod shape-determining protein MreC